MKKVKYSPFEKFVLRTPILPLDFFKELTTSSEIISDERIMEICQDSTVREAIFLASPSLSTQIDRWINNEITDVQKKSKLKYSILKYLSRMSSRCTPYGLFAGCAVGEFADETDILLDNISNYNRHTRLDMNYVVSLSYELLKDEEIKNKLKFYPNSSIYKIRDKVRYIEYHYKNNNRFHDIVAVDASEYLDDIISMSKNGVYIHEIVDMLVADEIDKEDAEEFVNELIENQILISELEPSVSGPEFSNQITKVLKSKFGADNENIAFIELLDKKLKILDSNIGNKIEKYIDISDIVSKKNIPFDLKFLFQCDLVITTKSNKIDRKFVKEIEAVINLLNKIRKLKPKTYLDQFREAFYERYEEHEMPISKVLDPEIGIGYGRNMESNDENPLLDGLFITQPNRDIKEAREIKWTIVDDIIQQKIIKAKEKNLSVIKIEDKDFSFLPETTLESLPDTLSFFVEMVKENGQTKLKFNGGGGGSGANLLARFSHSDHNIDNLVNEIIDFEYKSNPNKIIAEIIHLPEARVGNILSRPDFRKYEIPYLARSIKSSEHQINIEDIMISVRGNKIFLRSKKHNKEIIPRLTNAHNYSNNNALPIYHFLSDMQSNNVIPGVYLDVSNFDNLYKAIPRIEYKNIILSYATWNLNANDVKPLIDGKDKNNLQEGINTFRQNHSLPDLFLLSDGDNELLINLQNLTSVEMFVETIRKRQNMKLTEFIFTDDNQLVKDESGKNYSNEAIISFYKN
ncbi:hypothetical protein ACM39_12630 [Chryseobacterium sp. FH2]|uniref:lantibiotic dehydratase family protein n=1 Tax=Chryseobacterium sp. FH2 TaxID=1674291 RepID=UPI00065B0A7F|nr:lantibiotic dehydratase family protein [Chryseobacterium sp. FH2]KMQ67693.1 hypothetical protein ACM39_12630 [Chryseobacterium sp. FH2]